MNGGDHAKNAMTVYGTERSYNKQRSRSPHQSDNRDDRRRSRSPPREFRYRSRFQHREEQGWLNRRRHSGQSRSRSPPAREKYPSNDTRTRSSHATQASRTQHDQRNKAVTNESTEAEEDLLERLMGFRSFRSTKNTKVHGNDKNWAVSKNRKTEYRQYMNRAGGFNRPLSPGR